jgi:hypothetical protein
MLIEGGNELSGLVQMGIPRKYECIGFYEYRYATNYYECNMVSNYKPP